MATVYGDLRTKIEAGTQGDMPDPEASNGSLRVMYDEYTAAALAAGSVLEVGNDLPVGARIIDWCIDHAAMIGTFIKFGTTEDDDEFMALTITTAANKLSKLDDGIASSTGFVILAGTGTTLCITTSASAASGSIKVAVVYSVKS